MATFLSADHIHKQYGKFIALQDASLEMYQGEILALLGPNGAGKTTLIKILATLLNKDGGKVTILGYDLDRHPQEIRHLFGYVGQDTERSAYARLTVLENLRFFGSVRGMTKTEIDQQIDKLAHYFDFHSQLNKLFVTLSGGQKQTVVIMRAFLHNPPLVYLDEPTKGLDPIIARRIRTFLKNLVQAEGKALLLTSHVLSEVEEMAHRVALIQKGCIPICDLPEELKKAVGATEFIELEKDHLPERVIQRINASPQVRFQFNRTAQWLSFAVDDPLDGAEAIIGILRDEQVRARFRHHSISLEDTFLHYFGELSEKFDQ